MGVQFKLVVGIDFTESNYTQKLHTVKDHFLNEYQKALKGVCDILLNYVINKKSSVYGFGAVPVFENLE